MHRATIRLEYPDKATAQAVARAVSPENSKVPEGLTAKTFTEGKAVITNIELEGKLATLTATIDDLLEAASTAEKTLLALKKK